MSRLFTVTLEVRRFTGPNGETRTINEPELMYEAHQLIREVEGWPFAQFVKGPLEKPHEWWQGIIEGLEAIATRQRDDGKPSTKKQMAHKKSAGALVRKIADVLVRDPGRAIEERKPEQKPARTERLLAFGD